MWPSYEILLFMSLMTLSSLSNFIFIDSFYFKRWKWKIMDKYSRYKPLESTQVKYWLSFRIVCSNESGFILEINNTVWYYGDMKKNIYFTEKVQLTSFTRIGWLTLC